MEIKNSLQTMEEWRKALMTVGYCAAEGIAAQVAEWSEMMPSMIVSGPEFGGKSLLVESIIELINRENSVSSNNTCQITFTVSNNLGEMFYKWNGQMREQAMTFARQHGTQITPYEASTSSNFLDEGFLVRLLKKDNRLQYLVIDFFDGNFQDHKTDEYLARFLASREIYIQETGEILSLPEDGKLLIFVIRHSYEKSEIKKPSATEEVIAEKFFHLMIPEPTVVDKTEVLRFLHPELSGKFVRDFSLFTDEFNKLPDLQKKVSLGEFIDAAGMFIAYGQSELTTDALMQHQESIVKNRHDCQNFPANAAQVMAKIKV